MGLLDDVNATNNGIKPAVATITVPEQKEKSKSFISDEVITNWINEGNHVFDEKHVCMVLGDDGTGKSGLVLDHIAKKLKENTEAKALVIDLDSGCENLLQFHKEVGDRLRILNPIKDKKDEESNEVTIDYIGSLNQIKALVIWLVDNAKKEKYEYFVLDGLSTLLKYCERQMRLDRNLDVDGGVQTRFWMKRNKEFEELLELVKRLELNSYFVGHSDFILQQDSASIKQKTNALMWQRIICESKKDEKGNNCKYAKITKSKSNPLKEGKEFKFMAIGEDKVGFNSTKVFTDL